MPRLALVALLLLAACPQYSGPQPNETYFWQLKTSELEFNACSDAMDFRAPLKPLELTDNTFLIYKVSDDGKRAVTQDCTRVDTRTCTDSDAGVVFDIAGRELTFSRSTKRPVESTGCALQQTETWTLIDATTLMTLNLSNVLTLVDSPPACDRVEADLKARSPNMLGVEGCIIVNKVTGDIR